MKAHTLVIRGHQGTGKTTLGNELRSTSEAILLSKDDFYLPALEKCSDHTLASRIAYEAIKNTVLTESKPSDFFVVDAPFHDSIDVNDFLNSCRSNDILAKSILLVCKDTRQWNERLRQRINHPTPNHLITSVAGIEQAQGDIYTEHIDGELFIDTTNAQNTPQNIAKMCIKYMIE